MHYIYNKRVDKCVAIFFSFKFIKAYIFISNLIVRISLKFFFSSFLDSKWEISGVRSVCEGSREREGGCVKDQVRSPVRVGESLISSSFFFFCLLSDWQHWASHDEQNGVTITPQVDPPKEKDSEIKQQPNVYFTKYGFLLCVAHASQSSQPNVNQILTKANNLALN